MVQQENPLQKNQVVPLCITGMTAEGAGVGHFDGMAVFVTGTAPGDQIDCKIVKVLKKYCFGIVSRLTVPSPDRILPDCPCFSKCGGCVYRHISYEAELKIKTERIAGALERIGGISAEIIQPPIAAPGRSAYRNKAQIPLGIDGQGGLIMGFYGVHSHRIVDTQACLLQPEIFNAAMAVFRDWHAAHGDSIYDEATHSGVLRHLYLRLGEKTGELMVCVVINGQKLKNADKLVALLAERLPGLASVVLNINCEKTNVILGKTCKTLYGKDSIDDILCGLHFALSPLSFYQVNRSQAQALYERAAEYAALTPDQRLMDLYCGTGTIGLAMAHQAKSLVGVEIVPQAVENARQNARRNGIENAEFLCADAAQAAAGLQKRGEQPDVVVVDPPRKGLEAALIETIAQMGPQRVVYVSCDPATLARDLARFSALGYKARALTPCDLFPGTSHVETVCLMSKVSE